MEDAIRILVIDDDSTIADILKEFLSTDGRYVRACYNGKSAIDLLKKEPFDIIIVDLVMPDIGGEEVLKFAKRRYPDIVVIILTGHASVESAIMAIKEGAYDYIKKPCRLDEIGITIQNAIEKIKLNRENKKLVEKLKKLYRELNDIRREHDLYEEKDNKDLVFFPSNVPILKDTEKSLDDLTQRLFILKRLREIDIITEKEFITLRDRILKKMGLEDVRL